MIRSKEPDARPDASIGSRNELTPRAMRRTTQPSWRPRRPCPGDVDPCHIGSQSSKLKRWTVCAASKVKDPLTQHRGSVT